MPLVSIVIANYNYGRFLAEAIESVLAQSCPDYELIICDGGSMDNSLDVIKKYADRLAWWCSEPDKGQSDAFNKGFAHATGKYLTWLNADDVMLPGVIAALKTAATKHPDCEWFAGGCFFLDPEMKILKCNMARPFSEMRYRSGIVYVYGPSSFFTKRLLTAVGGVDVRFCYTMDIKLWFQFRHDCGVRYRSFIDLAWGFRFHADSKTSGQTIVNGKVVMSRLSGSGSEKRRMALSNERAWLVGDFKLVPWTALRRLLSVSWPAAIQGLWLSWKFRGRHYLDYYKEHGEHVLRDSGSWLKPERS